MCSKKRYPLRPAIIAIGLGLLIAGSSLVAAAPRPRPRRAPARPRLVPPRRVKPAPLRRRPVVKPPRKIVLAPRPRRVVVRRVGASVVVVSDSNDQAGNKPVVITSADQLQPVPQPSFAGMTAHKVTYVSDDLTVTIRAGERQRTVRMIGVAPVASADGDSDNPTADPESIKSVRNLLVGEFVYVAPGKASDDDDAPATKSAYLYRAPDNMLVNLEVVRQGFAVTDSGSEFRHASLFRSYEGKAKSDGKGIWQPVPPPAGAQASAD